MIGPTSNWVGSLGAHFSRYLLFSCGIAAYILVLLTFVRSFRLLAPNAGSTRSFLGGALLVTFGAMLLFALSPEPFSGITQRLGIGRSDVPESALSGGLIGQFFVGPPCGDEIAAGWMRGLIGEVGCTILGWILVTGGCICLYVGDWHELFLKFVYSPRTRDAAGGAAEYIRSRLSRRGEAEEDDTED